MFGDEGVELSRVFYGYGTGRLQRLFPIRRVETSLERHTIRGCQAVQVTEVLPLGAEIIDVSFHIRFSYEDATTSKIKIIERTD